ncbi:MAG: CRISPR-associated helicase Cas3' [Clostridiaceae bacterium]|jgi:CRISPR-associated endonuclease/helicase Cas3|nr:CRISPR-associated helicase Cas3' [Clostridiaceae bacterium]
MPERNCPYEVFYARSDNKKHISEWQTLETHLGNTSKLAEKFAEPFGLGNAGAVAALLHDMGKYCNAFQDRIRGKKTEKPDHAVMGAQFIEKNYNPCTDVKYGLESKQIIQAVIMGHHGGLPDMIDDRDSPFLTRLGKRTDYDDVISRYDAGLRKMLEEKLPAAFAEIAVALEKIDSAVKAALRASLPEGKKCLKSIVEFRKNFSRGLLVKLLYSCLIDADRTDAALGATTVENGFKYTPEPDYNFPVLAAKLDSKIDEFNRPENRKKLTEIRTKIYYKCREKGRAVKGIYKLDVPTGGGKTFASLGFALSHANAHSFKRIIFVLPYLSVIEQNAQKIREVFDFDSVKEAFWENKSDEGLSNIRSGLQRGGNFDSEIVFESHSNAVNDTDKENSEETASKKDSAFDVYEHPIVFTTMVQFLENLCGKATNGLRRFRNLRDSILVFDEIQALPVKCVLIFNEILMFLRDFCGCTVVLSSATVTCLDQLPCEEHQSFSLPTCPDVIDMPFPELENRVSIVVDNYPKNAQEIAEFAVDKLKAVNSALIVTNTKRECRDIYDAVNNCGSNIELFYLSTNMCAQHRADKIKDIEAALDRTCKGGKKVCVVSTQLIEAGVDLDFDTAIRLAAGLDSIIQAAGRCNREGKVDRGYVYVIGCKDENLRMLPEIEAGKNWTMQEGIFLQNKKGLDLSSKEIKEKFFERKYDGKFGGKEGDTSGIGLEYGIILRKRETNIFNLLSVNSYNNKKFDYNCNKWVAEETPLSNCKIGLRLRQAFKTAAANFSVIDERTDEITVIVPYGDGIGFIDKIKAGEYGDLKHCGRYTVNAHNTKEEYEIEEIDSDGDIFVATPKSYDSIFGMVSRHGK